MAVCHFPTTKTMFSGRRRVKPAVIRRECANLKNSETDDFVGCIGTVRVLFMG
jgi:hypothetical protein